MAEESSVRQAPGAARAETQGNPIGLLDRLGGIGQEVKDGLESAAASMTETVANVKESAQAVQDAVRDGGLALGRAFDLSAHVRRHPWLLVGGAVLVGFVAGSLVPGRRR